MRELILTIIITTSLNIFGQNNKLIKCAKEAVYAVNPKDTTQKILLNIYLNDTCGNETAYFGYDYKNDEPFESQKEKPSTLKEGEFREYIYKNKCLPLIVRVLDKDKKLLKRFIYKYNINNTIDQLTILDYNESQIVKYKYQYNKNGKLFKETRFNKENKADHLTIYEYDNDTISLETRIDLDDRDTIVCHYTYNSRKQLITEEWSDKNGHNKEIETSVYVDSLKVKEIYYVQETNKTNEYRMTYYDNGLMKTFKYIDPISGAITGCELSEYELYK